MRNYFKMRGLWVRGYSTQGSSYDQDRVIWADTKETELMRLDQTKQAITSDGNGPYNFIYLRAFVYFELNKENLATLLNGGGNVQAQFYNTNFPKYLWDGIPRLIDRNGFPFDRTGFFALITTVDYPSPRKTWSHGH